MKGYDVLFKVPVTEAAQPDGVRDTDLFFMREIDRLVDALLDERGLACTRLPEGRRDDWTELALSEVLRLPALSAKLF
jgi:hypothetical protein